MPANEGGYTLLWIPASGLFYRDGDFFDGRDRPIEWKHKVYVWPTYSRAEAAKRSVLARYPDAVGELLILPISVEGRD